MEVTDTYQEYLENRRKNSQREKIATLCLIDSDMASIGAVISEAVAAEQDRLSDDAKRKWQRILRGLQTAVQEAA